MSSNPTHIGTRQFHIDLVDNKGKLWKFDVNIKSETIDRLAANVNNAGRQGAWLSREKEHDVIWSIVEQAFAEQKNNKEGDRTFFISVNDENLTTPQMIITGKDVSGHVGYKNFELNPFTTLESEASKTTIARRSETKAIKAFKVIETTIHHTMLERFALEAQFSGKFGGLKKALHPLFSALGKHFSSIDFWWKNVIGTIDMPWNLTVLSEICDFKGAGSDQTIPLADALKYMSRLQKNTNPQLSKRLHQAVEWEHRLEKKQQKYDAVKSHQEGAESKLHGPLSQEILREVEHLTPKDQLFVPISHTNGESLLKISKQGDGTFSFQLIDSDGIISTFSKVKQDSLKTAIEKLTMFNIARADHDRFIDLLRGIGHETQSDFGTPKSSIGLVKSIAVDSLRGTTNLVDDYHDLALRARLFIDMANSSDNWLQNPDYHREVRKNCYLLLHECRSKLQDQISDKTLDKELAYLVMELDKIIAKTQKIHPKIVEVTDKPLEELSSPYFPTLDPQTLSTPVEDLVPKPLERNLEVAAFNEPGKLKEASDNVKKKTGWVDQADQFNLSRALKEDMQVKLVYSTGQEKTIIDANAVNVIRRKQEFPILTSLGLTNGEELALIYTLHSQERNALYSPLRQTHENTAKANYTFQTLIDHPRIGRSDPVQGWIGSQLFDEGRINILLSSPQGAQNLNHYLKEMVRQGEDLISTRPNNPNFHDDYKSGLYLLRLASQIIQFVEKDHPSKKDAILKDVMNPFEILLPIGPILTRSTDAKFEIAQSLFLPEFLGLVYDKLSTGKPVNEVLDDHLLALTLAAFRTAKLIKFSENPALKKKLDQLEKLVFAYAGQKLEVNEIGFIKNYLTDIKSTLSNEDLIWQIAEPPQGFPILQANRDGQTVQLDLVTGDVFTGGKRAARLPSIVGLNDDVKRLFPNAAKLLWPIENSKDNPNISVYTHPTMQNLRIVFESSEVEGEAPKVNIERHLNDVDTWVIYKQYPAQVALANAKVPTGAADDLPLKIASAIGPKSCWVSREGDRVYVYDMASNTEFGIFKKTDDDEGSLQLSTGQKFLQIEPDTLQRFLTIGDAEEIALFGDETSAKIDYPRLELAGTNMPLTYNAENNHGKCRVTSPLFKGWELAPFGVRPGKQGEALPPMFQSFQMLKKGSQQKVLIPERELELVGNENSIKGTFATKPMLLPNFGVSKVFEYTLNPETNRLESTSSEANLLLAYVNFVHQDYDAALFYLDKSRTGTDYTEGSKQILEWIQTWSDTSDRGQNVKKQFVEFSKQVDTKSTISSKQRAKTPTGDVEDATEILKEIQEIEARLGPPVDVSQVQEMVVTTANQTREVIGRNRFASLKRLFKLEKLPLKEVDESFFDRPTDEPAVRRVNQEHKADLEAAKIPQIQASISAKNAKTLLNEMTLLKQKLIADTEDAKRRALASVEVIKGAGLTSLQQRFGEEERVSLEDLIKIWRSGSLLKTSQVQRLNELAKRELKPEELKELDWAITEYMSAYSELKHVERVIKAGDDYLASFKEFKEGDPQLAQNLFDLTSTKREYALLTSRTDFTIDDIASITARSPDIKTILLGYLKVNLSDGKYRIVSARIEDALKTHSDLQIARALTENLTPVELKNLINNFQINPQYRQMVCQLGSDPDYRKLLSIEYSIEVILRSKQTYTIRRMISDPNFVGQLGMGEGKSAIVTPLVAEGKATGKNLVAVNLPDALYETNRRDLDVTNRKLFGKEYLCFEYKRSSTLTSTDLYQIYLDLLKVVESEGFIAINKSSALSFRNAYITKCNELGNLPVKDQEEGLATIRAMAKILTLFKERMDVIGDEIHLGLDVTKEVNFAYGDPIPIDPIKSEIGIEFLEIILSAPDGSNLAILKNALETNTQNLIPPDDREQFLREVASVFWEKHQDWNLGDKTAFIQYITADPTYIGTGLPPFMAQLRDENPLRFKQIASLKGFMTIGFKETFAKSCLVNYGRESGSSKPFTIPFKASNTPSTGSEFDEEIQRVSYTLQDYFFKPIDQSLVFSCVERLLDKADEQRKIGRITNPSFSYQDTKIFKDFKALMERMDPDNKMSRDLMHYVDNEESVQFLTEMINTTPLARINFCKFYTLDSEMKLYPLQVSSKGEDLVDMVHAYSGFSGTPWNLHTYHDKIHAEKTLGVDGRSYLLMLQQNTPVQTLNYDARDPVTSLTGQLSFGPGGFNALIDTGALLRGINNSQFVQKVMKGKSENAVGIYFNESDKIVGLKSNGQLLDSEQITLDNLAERIVLYDDSHTVGADIKLYRKAKGAVTIGPDTGTSALFQAIWRERQLHLEQRVVIIVTKEVAKLILGNEYPRDLTIQDILAFCLKNEALREAKDNFRAESDKISGFGSRVMFDQLVQAGLTYKPEKIAQLSNHYAPVLLKGRNRDEEYEAMATVSSKLDPFVVLNDLKAKQVEIIKKISDTIPDGFDPFKAELTAKAAELQNRPDKPREWMPNDVNVTDKAAGEVEAQAEAQVAIEAHQLKQLEEQVEEEAVEVPILPSNEAGGSTEVAGKPIGVETLTNLGSDINTSNLSIGSDASFRRLSNLVDAFDPRIFIGCTYEGRMSQDAAPYGVHFSQIGKAMNPATERAQTILHSERLPINEALFYKGPAGWRAVFGSTHDSYPSFGDFTKQANTTPSAFVMISASGPIFIDKNNAFNTLPPSDRNEFMKLFVQIKFLKGEFNYSSKQEIDALTSWIKEKGISNMRFLFEKVIRPTKSKDDQLGYGASPLRRLFDDLESASKAAQADD